MPLFLLLAEMQIPHPSTVALCRQDLWTVAIGILQCLCRPRCKACQVRPGKIYNFLCILLLLCNLAAKLHHSHSISIQFGVPSVKLPCIPQVSHQVAAAALACMLAAQAVPLYEYSAIELYQPQPPPQQLAQLLLPAPLYVLIPAADRRILRCGLMRRHFKRHSAIMTIRVQDLASGFQKCPQVCCLRPGRAIGLLGLWARLPA